MPSAAEDFFSNLPGGYVLQRERDGQYYFCLTMNARSFSCRNVSLKVAVETCLVNAKMRGNP